MKLYSQISGQGFPVLLIHGLFGMSDNLAMIGRPLAEHFQVHSLDLRNHGRSPRAPSMTLSEMAGDVLAYLDHQGIERAHLLGHSLGGKVAMQLALLAPERVERLIAADIAPVTYEQRGHDDVFAGIMAVDLAAMVSRKQAEEQMAQHITEPGVRQFILKNLYRDGDKGFAWRINVEVLHRCYDQLRQGVVVDNSDSHFAGEVLFIKGDLSPYIQEQHRPAIEQLFPRAQLKVIKDAGHWLHAEKPVAFNQLVAAFLPIQ